tara:strand:- start:303 stop:551 length:249 start_codon:yes stop_codon:yes gene_type:complete
MYTSFNKHGDRDMKEERTISIGSAVAVLKTRELTGAEIFEFVHKIKSRNLKCTLSRALKFADMCLIKHACDLEADINLEHIK